jgi:CBS domain-containing protein
MTREVETFDADTDLVTAAQRFPNSRYRRFPVVEGKRVLGQVSRRDVMRTLLELWSCGEGTVCAKVGNPARFAE